MGLSKMGIIAAPTKEPRAVVKQSSDWVAIFVPALAVILQCQQVLGAVSLSLYTRACWFSWQAFLASRTVARQVYIATVFLLTHSAFLGAALWQTKSAQRFQRKLEFEFFTLMLSSTGNSLCLLIFWPGWWVLGLGLLAVRLCVG
ncbi:hypothetical protein GGS26DRAFT_185035 [Hypomontagnella submonticulosa]|nr:hypothetical protein GGS26DRAFT_185035 [Hypomontagnella submonticulosa]